MPNTPASKNLIGITQAAEHLGVARNTIRRRISDGTLTAYRLGPKLIRVDLAELEEKLVRPIPSASVSDR